MAVKHNSRFFKYFAISMFFLNIALGNPGELFAACNPPVPTHYTDRQLNSIRVNWANLNSNDSWEIELRLSGEVFIGIPTTGIINSLNYNFTDLLPGHEYCFRIRGICDGEAGNWSAPFCFISTMDENNSCGLGFDLKDPTGNQSYADAEFYFRSELFPEGELGKDVFIKDVQLVIEHNWPSDLEIFLQSPGGKTMTMSQKNGFNSLHYGNPDAENCDSVALFSDEACNEISDLPSLLGEFKPEERFSSLYDSSSIEGNWKLTIRDHNSGHQGKLHFWKLDLVQSACRLPQEIFVQTAGPNTSRISWSGEEQDFDQLQLEYGPSGFNPGNGTIINLSSDLNEFFVSGLESNNAYDFYFKSNCQGELSIISCPYTLITDCNEISVQEDFNSVEICELKCTEICNVSDQWFNNYSTNNQWLVNSGTTATEGTGPKNDVSGFGNYLYVESSENECNFDSLAILETDCMKIISNQDGCDFSFYYNMNGPDVGKLQLDVSVDDGENWTNLFEIEGDQGDEWENVNIDLGAYHDMVGRFRFVATAQTGYNSDRGDIAIDDISFYGTSRAIEAQYLFFRDADADNYGAAEAFFFCSNSLMEGYARNNLDCDDSDPSSNPGADEIPCNSIDENCNGMEDDLSLEDPLKIELILQQDESCPGSTDGTIILKIEGGVGPYSFLWSNGSQDSILTDVSSGKYQCEIRDQLSCLIITDSLQINAGANMNFYLLEKSIVSCQGAADGKIRVDHTGGTAPYHYTWSNGETTKNLEDLGPGKYQLTITDASGCQLTSPEIILSAATNFTAGFQIIHPSCNGIADGEVNIIGIQDGQSPFSYAWSTGDTLDQITDLNAGVYALTITDGSFCYEVYDSIKILDPEPVTASIIAKDNVTCYGDNDGAIEINAGGGSAPYTFKWTRNGQLFSTKDDLFNLKAGLYQLTLKDNNACEFVSDSLWIIQPEAIQIGLDTIQFADCSASENGMIDINVTGGSGEYQYFWNGLEQGNDSYQDLSPGLYNVVVTDKYGCKAYRGGIQLGFLDIPLDASLHLIDSLSCYGDKTATLEVRLVDAALPADFNWSAGVKHIKHQLSDTLFLLKNGNYNVTITDAEGCIGISEWKMINEPDPVLYEISDVVELDCANDHTGSIQIEIFGGVPPYQINWNNGDQGSLINYLDGGYYVATVLDHNLCELFVDSIYVFEPDSLGVEVETESAHLDQANGTATIVAYGGTSPYYFLWDENAGGQTTAKAVGLARGEYWCTVTDFHGCEKEVYVYVDSDDVGIDNDGSNNSILIFPNPANDLITVKTSTENDRILRLSLYDLLGIIHIDEIPIQENQEVELKLEGIESANYMILIQTRQGTVRKKITIAR